MPTLLSVAFACGQIVFRHAHALASSEKGEEGFFARAAPAALESRRDAEGSLKRRFLLT
jgi:hypothetical protein